MTDQPHPPDPYPDHLERYPGARQPKAPDQHLAWEFTNDLPVTRPVVHPTPQAPTRVITLDPTPRHPDPFTAHNPAHRTRWDRPPRPINGAVTTARRVSVFPWVSVMLMLAAQGTLGAATAIGRLPALVGAVAMTSMAICGLVLIAAELVHRTDTRNGSRRDEVSGSMAPRRDEHDGRSLKRRPVGLGAAEGGGARPLLGNGETSCTGGTEVIVWR